MKLLYGDSAARLVSERVAAPVTSVAVLKQTPANRRVDGMVVQITADNTFWQWEDSSAVTGDDILAITPTDAPSTGRWLRMPGAAMLALPVYATTPTGTNLLTVPTGCILAPREFAWRVDRVFTGASNAGIAVSSSNHAGHTGVGGFAASMVATNLNQALGGTGMDFVMGPVASGTFDSVANKRLWMKPGDTIRLDVIGANFGTGAGAVLVQCDILKNSGA